MGPIPIASHRKACARPRAALGVALALCSASLWPPALALRAATPPPAAQAEAAIEAALRDTLQRYATALESRDANAVKKVHPSVPAESLAKALKDMRELKVVIADLRVISVDGVTARVSCSVMQTLTPHVGSRQTTSVTRVLRLRRQGDTWVIDSFER